MVKLNSVQHRQEALSERFSLKHKLDSLKRKLYSFLPITVKTKKKKKESSKK